jgi:hypothetical protein
MYLIDSNVKIKHRVNIKIANDLSPDEKSCPKYTNKIFIALIEPAKIKTDFSIIFKSSNILILFKM